jgi:urea transport system substrate-binding protein
MEATWISFNLWKEAVTRAGAVDVDHVRRALSGLRVRAPSGFEVFMDAANHHLHKPVVIGRITPAARIVPVWMSDHLIAPEPWSPWLNRSGSPEPRVVASHDEPALALAS